MGINDVINMLSINNTHANLWHQKLIKRNLNFNEWMHKLKELKTKSCVRLIHSLLFIFSLMLDYLIKQQTAAFKFSILPLFFTLQAEHILADSYK